MGVQSQSAYASDRSSAKGQIPHEGCNIPAATTQCHASNLLLLRDGDLLCAWFGGSEEGRPDISIYLARRSIGSGSWSEAIKVTHDNTRSEQNPVLFETAGSELWLLYTSQNAGDQDSAVVRRQTSTDGGRTWNKPTVLFPELGTFIRQPVVILEDQTLVIPTFKCRTEPGISWNGSDDNSYVHYSRDGGQAWKQKEIPNSFGAVHMEIKELANKSYLGLFRSRWADDIYRATSSNGIDWSEPVRTSLPNPNAGICFDVLPSGRVLVVYNHSSRAGLSDDIAGKGDLRIHPSSKHAGKEVVWGVPRAPLCVAWSDDDGLTFQSRLLQDGDGYCISNNSEEDLNRELSYPSMAIGQDGLVHIAFTFWRQKIRYVTFKPEVLDT